MTSSGIRLGVCKPPFLSLLHQKVFCCCKRQHFLNLSRVNFAACCITVEKPCLRMLHYLIEYFLIFFHFHVPIFIFILKVSSVLLLFVPSITVFCLFLFFLFFCFLVLFLTSCCGKCNYLLCSSILHIIANQPD